MPWPTGRQMYVIVVGLAADAALAVLPHPNPVALRAVFLAAGIVGNALATGLYIGAGLGPGPRDGLMTGLAGKGVSIRLARTGIEVTVLAVGWLLGGTVGVGTLLYAVNIGPLAHYLIPRLTVPHTRMSAGRGSDGTQACARLRSSRRGPLDARRGADESSGVH
jgi:uncharacterized membrane protein YczE